MAHTETGFEETIRAEKVEVLARNTDASNLVGAALAILLTITATPSVQRHVWLWFYVYMAMTVVRLVWMIWFRRKKRPPAEVCRLGYVLAAFLFWSGVMWGIFGFLTFDPKDPTYMLFIATVQTGLGAQALGSLSVYTPALISFCLPIVAGFVVPRVTDGSNENLMISGMAIAFVTFLLYAGRNAERGRTQAIRLRYKNQWLIEDLQESNVKAEAASRAKSEFLAVMSHEIRTPMNGIGAMAELLSDAPLADEHQKMVAIIRQSTDGLLGILGDILDYAKIEAGQLSIDLSVFDLRDLAENVLQILAVRAEEKGVDLILDMGAGTSTAVRGDPARLRQILFNLVSNAVKFTATGYVLLRVTRDRDGLQFDVIDTGSGIALDVQPKLFHPFIQADSSVMRRFGGAGLGLSICKRLVEMMNGSISLTSTLGTGTAVHFALPLEAVPSRKSMASLHGIRLAVAVLSPGKEAIENLLRTEGAVATETIADAELVIWEGMRPEGNGPDIELMSFRRHMLDRASPKAVYKPVRAGDLIAAIRERLGRQPVPVAAKAVIPQFTTPTRARAEADRAIVLVVEDHAINRLVTVKLLDRLGLLYDVAEDGLDALDCLKRNGYYGLVLTDLHMPRMDGIALARSIRRDLASGLPIVAVTADALPETLDRCTEAGFSGYLTKPLRLNGLQEMIARWIVTTTTVEKAS